MAIARRGQKRAFAPLTRASVKKVKTYARKAMARSPLEDFNPAATTRIN
jgi:hypothetical protein